MYIIEIILLNQSKLSLLGVIRKIPIFACKMRCTDELADEYRARSSGTLYFAFLPVSLCRINSHGHTTRWALATRMQATFLTPRILAVF